MTKIRNTTSSDPNINQKYFDYANRTEMNEIYRPQNGISQEINGIYKRNISVPSTTFKENKIIQQFQNTSTSNQRKEKEEFHFEKEIYHGVDYVCKNCKIYEENEKMLIHILTNITNLVTDILDKEKMWRQGLYSIEDFDRPFKNFVNLIRKHLRNYS